MDFSWTPLQEDLYQRTLQFAERALGAPAPGGSFPVAAWRACGEFGLLGACVPEAHGGLGLDAQTTARVVEAFGRGCADTGLVFSASAHLFACVVPVLTHGSEGLKDRVLRRMCSGEWIAANAITEAGAGSDVFALSTRAVRDGDHYVLSGEKSYVTNGPVADVLLVYASTEPSHGYLGISAFLVDAESEGVTVGRPFEKAGLSTSPISAVYLDEVRVPHSRRLGDEGEGAAIFNLSMQWERACLFAGYLGAMERQLDACVRYARERRQFKKPIGKHQAVSHRIADMKLRLDAARLLLYRACWLLDQGVDPTLEVSLAKLAVSEAAIQSGLDTIQIHGGLGYMSEAGFEQGLRDALPATIFSGTSEIQRDVIARRLGL